MNPSLESPAKGPKNQDSLDLREFEARSLWMQLQVFTGCRDSDEIVTRLRQSGLEGVAYLDVNDPRGIGLLVMTEDPKVLVKDWRLLLSKEPFLALTPRPEMTLLGRTYAAGREADPEDRLLHKPRRRALNPDFLWAVWYPLRRKSEFELLPKEEQAKILMEHARIGMAYGQADLAHDIRLACYGMDKNDNEFVLGIVSRELAHLSRLVQDMRKTRQTARWLASLGPFFVGKVLWQAAFKK